MVSVRLMIRAVLGHEAIEFEKALALDRPPFRGQAVALGPGGEFDPVFVASVQWSPVFGSYVARCEDDVANGIDPAALAEAYEAAGWRERARVSLLVSPPRRAS